MKKRKYVTTLECDHCGDIAIKADKNGNFTDGAGGKCISCGWPGHVSCDAEEDPWWQDMGEDDTKCDIKDCVQCEDL